MSFSNTFLTIFFCLVLSTSFKTTLTYSPQQGKKLATIHIITNSLPKNNPNPVEFKLRCTNSKQNYFGVETTLKWGDDYQFGVEERATYFCETLWGRYFGSWHAFQPKRDIGHESLFWLVKPSGFFFSWDNSTWVKKAVWETD